MDTIICFFVRIVQKKLKDNYIIGTGFIDNTDLDGRAHTSSEIFRKQRVYFTAGMYSAIFIRPRGTKDNACY